jgi:hypothetical protein
VPFGIALFRTRFAKPLLCADLGWLYNSTAMAVFVVGFLSLLAAPVLARGTNAGTVIANQAELRFSQGGVEGAVVRSNRVQFSVYEVIDVAVQSLDAASVASGSPDLNVALAFRVTNLGNAPGVFRLERALPTNPGDFVPTPANAGSIFIENGLQPGFQASGPFADTRYLPGTNDLSLTPDGHNTIYLVSDVQSNLANGHIGRALLRAFSLIPNAAGAIPGTSITKAPINSDPAIVGTSSAVSQAMGSYAITGTRVVMTKTQVAIRAPNSGTALIPGSEVDYLIEIQVFGSSGHVDDFELDDPLPSTLSYINNSLKINGVAKTDVPDTDEAQVINERLTIRLGKVFAGNRFLITYSTRLR